MPDEAHGSRPGGIRPDAARCRGLDELAGWLGAALTFPVGAVLLTGTCLVPPDEVTLRAGDEVTVEIPGLGVLHNAVEVVGAVVAPG